jgi:cytochrome c553
MRHSIFIIASVPVALAILAPAHAQPQPAAGGAMGQQIATSGAPGVAACASCHGARGEGNAASNFPRIAGQGEGYLARQLMAYADGSRVNPIMTPIAKGMNQQQIDAVSLYYAALQAPSPQTAAAKADKMQARGRTLANIGDDSIGVQSCANCHGPAGIGEPPNYPYLASQYSGYLTTALGEFKNGTRKADPSQMMNIISKRLSDADIKAVSAYYAAQPAPPPAAKRANIPAGSALRPVMPSSGGPGGQPSVPVQGTGVEQGAPTTGGGQGPGGGGGASGTGPQGAPQ